MLQRLAATTELRDLRQHLATASSGRSKATDEQTPAAKSPNKGAFVEKYTDVQKRPRLGNESAFQFRNGLRAAQ